MVDALRFDFIEPEPTTSAASDFHNRDQSAPRFFRSKVPFVAELLARAPARARLLKFVADPPTVTAQRLKGLTTGGLPTFLEIRQNFASAVVEEDTWVAQIKRCGRRVGHLGDDTWENLFPRAFDPSLPLESFNTQDLHTVDDTVRAHLASELKNPGWAVMVRRKLGNMLIAHAFVVA